MSFLFHSFLSIGFLRERPFDRPISMESIVKAVRPESKFSGPILDALGFAAKCYHLHLVRIPRLVSTRRPSTVAGLVGAIVVDALDGVFGRPRPHVFHEVRKPVFSEPAVTNGYPTTSVMFELFGLRPKASTLHVPPCGVFIRWGSSVFASAMSVFEVWHDEIMAGLLFVRNNEITP